MPAFFLPTIGVAVVLSILASGPASRTLGSSRLVAALLVLGFGIVLVTTLTPGAAFGYHGANQATCDFSRLGLPSWRELMSIYDAGGNILMFIPLGFSIGLLPRSRLAAAILAFAVVLPFAIETTQLLVQGLGRACQSGDVIDNLTGLALGLLAGAATSAIVARRSRRADRQTG